MSVVHFQCPSCQAPLRLQNRALFVGRTFDCPDCHESLLIEAEGSTGVKAKVLPRSDKPDRNASEGSSNAERTGSSLPRRAGSLSASNVSDHGVALQPPMSVWDRLSRRPAALGWIVAALFAVIFLIVVNSGREQVTPESVASAEAQIAVKSADENSPTSPSDERNSHEVDSPDPAMPEANAAKAVAKLEPPPIPEPITVVDPPREDKPAPVVEKPPMDEPKSAPMPTPAVLSPEAVEAKLGQKIVRFDQIKPAPFVKVLDTIEELAGVPIVWDLDRVDDEQLQKPVTLQLRQMTVGEILDTLLKQVGLERRTVEGKIELRPMAQGE